MALPRLPAHIEPMLARIGQPFDSAAHVFEVKWDGVRAMSYVEAGGWRMHGRRRRDLAARYPELAFLADLPAGTVLDGELVVLGESGKPDFPAILRRENGSAARAAQAARDHPVVYVAFDLLYLGHEALLGQCLRDRRAALAELVGAVGNARLVVADGVVDGGHALFRAACEQGLEGIVAKRLDAPYRPGERGDAWIKIKASQTIHCLVLGFEPDGHDDFKSLIVATDLDGELRCVGKVGTGFTEQLRRELRPLLFARRAEQPLIPNQESGVWLRPGLYCTVRYQERTASGNLRAPVLVDFRLEDA